jgi:hypothetical protein
LERVEPVVVEPVIPQPDQEPQEQQILVAAVAQVGMLKVVGMEALELLF